MATQESHDRPLQAWPAVNTVEKQAFANTSHLHTPPENMADSFSQNGDSDDSQAIKGWQEAVHYKLAPIQPQTPPASPEFQTLPGITSATGLPAHDTPLFPARSEEQTQSQSPLFEERSQTPSPPSERIMEPELSVRTSIAATSHADDIYPSSLRIKNQQAAMQYWYDRLAELRKLQPVLVSHRTLPSPKLVSSEDLDHESQRQLHSLTRSARVSKPQSAPRPSSKPKAPAAASPQKASSPKASPPKKRTPKPRTYSDFVDNAFPVAQQSSKHKRAPPTKKVENGDVHWTELPDYAPPTSTLDISSKTLKASWHGSLLDLSSDPNRHHLHAQEIGVASVLRLECAKYMLNKRKIFAARLEALREGRNFTRTAAQSACHMDVNKASQMWEAFDRVGWFNPSWFEKWL